MKVWCINTVLLFLCVSSLLLVTTYAEFPLRNIINKEKSKIYPGIYDEPVDKAEARKMWKVTPWSRQDIYHDEAGEQAHRDIQTQRMTKFTAEAEDAQRDFLVEFYESLGGPNWRHSDNWNTSADICTWYGIECDGKWVHYITLDRNGLVGKLPQFDWPLPYLATIDLSDNKIDGEIPPSLAGTEIRAVVLESNALSGSIPDAFGASRMTLFHVADNRLSGKVPESLFNDHIMSLTLDLNAFSGELSIPFGYSFSKLKRLTASYNAFNGFVSDIICTVPEHTECSLKNNDGLICSYHKECGCQIDQCNCEKSCSGDSCNKFAMSYACGSCRDGVCKQYSSDPDSF